MEITEEIKIKNEKETSVANLIKLAEFLRDFRIVVASKKGPLFLGGTMCHVDEKLGIRINKDAAVIRNGDDEFSISRDCIYYDSLKILLETMFEGKVKKRKILRQIDFLFRRVMARHDKILKKIADDMSIMIYM